MFVVGGLRRTLAKLPITLPGWHREEQVLRVPLFQRYRERADVPFANFRAILQVQRPESTTAVLSCLHFFLVAYSPFAALCDVHACLRMGSLHLPSHFSIWRVTHRPCVTFPCAFVAPVERGAAAPIHRGRAC